VRRRGCVRGCGIDVELMRGFSNYIVDEGFWYIDHLEKGRVVDAVSVDVGIWDSEKTFLPFHVHSSSPAMESSSRMYSLTDMTHSQPPPTQKAATSHSTFSSLLTPISLSPLSTNLPPFPPTHPPPSRSQTTSPLKIVHRGQFPTFHPSNGV